MLEPLTLGGSDGSEGTGESEEGEGEGEGMVASAAGQDLRPELLGQDLPWLKNFAPLPKFLS